MYAINFEELQWESPLPGVRFKSCTRDGKKLRIAEFTNEFIEPDWCEKGHVGIVLSGELEIDIRGQGGALPGRHCNLYPCGSRAWPQRAGDHADGEAVSRRRNIANLNGM